MLSPGLVLPFLLTLVPIALGADSNTTEVCSMLKEKLTSASTVRFPDDPGYERDIAHFAVSVQQNSTCSVEPGTSQDVATIIQLVGSSRVPFAVKGGGHNLNPGFSSTRGVQITMTNFNQVFYQQNTSTVDIGSGLTWDEVYSQLESYNVTVVGARATGVGVAGLLLGGGYSYKTNQYGLAADNIVAMEVVLPDGQVKTVTASTDKDLFFALRGGGNNFGIVTKFTLKAHPQTAVWGGSIIYPSTEFDAVSAAVLNYTSNNADPKSVIQCTFATLQGQGIIMVNLFYDAPASPASGLFDAFLTIPSVSSDIGVRSYLTLVESAGTDVTANMRGLYNTVSHTAITPALMQVLLNETLSYGSQLQSQSLFLNGYALEPFLPQAYKQGDTDTAYPPNRNENIHPMNVYYAWTDAQSDSLMLETSHTTVATLDQFLASSGIRASAKYPNYALYDTKVEDLYGDNLARLRSIKKQVDPSDVMGLAGGFKL
ncbi:hypothetical protein PM082_012737 [Marasmius tenuissimus]|nr:hypothetical protein PM082_012737 [Marasmius tenuissimus]